jgi:soluble lytic murein transglycosylase-like protein
MRPVALAVLLVLSAAALPAAGQVYTGTSSSGSVVLSNFVSVETPNRLILDSPAAVPTAIEPASFGSSATDVGAIVMQVAQEIDVSPQLLHAVISVESAYDPRAVSPKGAKGLMQLMPATAQRFGVRDPFDPHENVRGGARYLKALLAQFDGDLQLTLAAYNAGEYAVIRHGNRVPPFAETQKYVPKVIARMQRADRS